jgi:hypothetical protein
MRKRRKRRGFRQRWQLLICLAAGLILGSIVGFVIAAPKGGLAAFTEAVGYCISGGFIGLLFGLAVGLLLPRGKAPRQSADPIYSEDTRAWLDRQRGWFGW